MSAKEASLPRQHLKAWQPWWHPFLSPAKTTAKTILQCLAAAAAAAKSLQSCPTLCNPIDGSPPGSPVPGILQARTLAWVAISFSNAWKWKVKVKSLSRVQLSATPWTAAHQAPPSMAFSRQECWSGVPLPSPLQCVTILVNLNVSLSHHSTASWRNFPRCTSAAGQINPVYSGN